MTNKQKVILMLKGTILLVVACTFLLSLNPKTIESIRNAHIDEKTGVEFTISTEAIFSEGSQWRNIDISLTPLPNDNFSLSRSSSIIKACLRRFPDDLINKYLKKAYVAQSLTTSGRPIGGIAAYNEIIIKWGSPNDAMERACLHEIAHIFLDRHSMYFDTHAWTAINDSSFRYDTSGLDFLIRNEWATDEIGVRYNLVLADTLAEHGFLTPYSPSHISEDFADYTSFLFTGDKTLWRLAEKYQKVRRKLSMTIRFYNQIDTRFSDTYFKKQVI